MSENKKKIYSLTNDIIFKAVYGRDDDACKKALIAMLNLLLDRKNGKKIVNVEIKNPMNNPDRERGKESILDVKCKTNSGEIIGVEMQVKRKPDLEKRIIYYQGKKIGDSLNKAEEYATIKKVVTICIMVENLFANEEEFHSIYRYKNIVSGRELSEVSELHFFELSKIDIEQEVSEMDALERYGLYLLYANDNAHFKLMEAVKAFDDEVILMTEPILRKVTADERIRQAADDREMFLWDLEVDKILREQEIQQIKQAKQDAELAKQDAELAKQDAELAKQDAELAKQDAELARQNAELARQNAERITQELEHEVDRIRHSAVIKMKRRGLLPKDISEIIGITVAEVQSILK